MGIFDRFSTLLRSNINDLISRAEDPEKMLNQILVDMRVAAREGQAAGRHRHRRREAAARPGRRRVQAGAGLGAARRCSRSRKAATTSPSRRSCARASTSSHGQQLEQTWETHRLETEKLKNSLRDLNDKIEEAKRKKNLLVARQRRAQAQKRIAETMSSMSEKSAFEAFARMEERIENERAPAQGVGRDRGGVHRRRARAGLQAAREGRRRRQRRRAAPRAQAEDGHASCRHHRASKAARRRRGVTRRPCTPRSRTSRARRRAVDS